MIHAVMFLLTFNATSLEITHAQVIGGYETLDACQSHMGHAMAMISPQLNEDELPQLECATVKTQPGDPDEPAKPKTDI